MASAVQSYAPSCDQCELTGCATAAVDCPPDELAGRCLDGKFVLRKVIGDGATGRVYCATQVALSRCVAVKVLHPQLSQRPSYVARFREEALVASRLTHPTVVATIDFGHTSDDVSFIAMELVRGPTLREFAGGIAQPPARVVALVSQVLDALEAAHSVGIVHADIKGDNILVRQECRGCGHGDTIKVFDFGIANAIPHPLATRTTNSFLCGTPGYIAPEVILGEPAEPTADVYAVGVLLYELLTGAPPFSGDTPTELLSRQIYDDLVPPSVYPDARVTPQLDAVVCRALAKRPEDRYATAAQLREALLGATRGSATDCATILAMEVTSEVLSCGSTWSLEDPAVNEPPGEDMPALRQDPHATQRAAVGEAIRSGSLGDIVERYLDLVTALAVAGERDAVFAELDEALDLVTGGAGPDDEHVPPIAWRLLDELAVRHHQWGDDRRALLASLRALRLAKKAESVLGQRRSADLVSLLQAGTTLARLGCRQSVHGARQPRRPLLGARRRRRSSRTRAGWPPDRW